MPSVLSTLLGPALRAFAPEESVDFAVHLRGPLDEEEVACALEYAQLRIRYGPGQGAGDGGRHVAVLGAERDAAWAEAKRLKAALDREAGG